jgi:hypothetical protein
MRRSEEVGTAFKIDSGEEIRKDADARGSETSSGIEADFAGKPVEAAVEGGDCIGEAKEAGIAADFADGAEDTDGPELLEDVGVAKDGGLERCGFVMGLMLAYAVEDGGNFRFRKAGIAEDLRRVSAGISHVIPATKGFRFLRAVADEDAEVVEPGCGTNDVAIVIETGANRFGERVETGLMAEFVTRAGLFQNDPTEDRKVIGWHRTFVTQSASPTLQMCQIQAVQR